MKKIKQKLILMLSMIMVTGLVGCSKPTIESLKKDIESQNFSTVIKHYSGLESEDKTKVDEYITLSIANIMTEYGQSERTEEGKDEVIKKIEELEAIQKDSTVLTEVLGACKSVTNDYYTNQQTFNTAESLENLEDSLPVYKNLQEACKDDEELLKKVNLKIEEISSKLTTDIKKGSKIDVGGFDITFNKFEFSYDVLPKNTSGFYTHYEADKGKVYYHVAMDLKNNNNQNITGDEILKAELIYNNDYKYDGFIVLDETDGSGFDYANITSITPLETRGVRVLFDIPEEVESSKESLVINIEIDGKIYSYKAR